VKYTLIDYSISKEDKPKSDAKEFESIVKAFRQNAITPSSYSKMASNNLDDVTEEGLASELKTLLKVTNEGSLTSQIFLNGQYHIFYIAKKDLVETENYTKQKDKIHDELFEASVKNEVSYWFEREKNKHYIKLSN
jgi:peptidyl-prolyl cis-trans isomerase SurA